jgi:hypothetical protein
MGDAYMSPAGVVVSGLPMPDLSTSAAFPAPIAGPTGTLLQVHSHESSDCVGGHQHTMAKNRLPYTITTALVHRMHAASMRQQQCRQDCC